MNVCMNAVTVKYSHNQIQETPNASNVGTSQQK
jgi:hypothetical protein